jgi:hypothetical protein
MHGINYKFAILSLVLISFITRVNKPYFSAKPADAQTVASKITGVTAPGRGAKKLTMPWAPPGYKIAIKSADPPGYIDPDGNIAPCDTEIKVSVIFTVTRKINGDEADTGIVSAIIPATADMPAAYGPVTIYPDQGDRVAYGNGALSPRAIQLQNQPDPENNGRILVTFECSPLKAQPTDENPFPLRPVFPIWESLDTGATWSHIGDVGDTQNAYNRHGIAEYIDLRKDGDYWGLLNCPHLFELPAAMGDYPSGTILCAGISAPYDRNIKSTRLPDTEPAYKTLKNNPDGAQAQTYLELYASRDLGRTWEYVSTIKKGGSNTGEKRNEYGGAIWEPFILFHNGRLICYYSDENDPDHSQVIAHKATADLKKWGKQVTDTASAEFKGRPGMAVVTKTGDGRFFMVYEIKGIADRNYFKISDDPENWGKDGGDFYLGEPWVGVGSPYAATLRDGRVVYDCYGSKSVRVNSSTSGVGNDWEMYPAPCPPGYNPCVIELLDGRLFVTRCPGFWQGEGAKNITCGTIAINPPD